MKTLLAIDKDAVGGKTMKKNAYMCLGRTMWLVAVILTVLLMQAPVEGVATNCLTSGGALDLDCDGLSDGIDPASSVPDVFVILKTATSGSFLTAPAGDYFVFLNQADGGLGVNVRVVNATTGAVTGLENFSVNVTTREISHTPAGGAATLTGQKAIKVTESTSATSSILGECQQGTPNDLDGCIIYTKKIDAVVTTYCGSKGTNCIDVDASPNLTGKAAILPQHFKNTITHEAAHSMNTVNPCSTDIGCHYPTLTGSAQASSVLDQVVYTYSCSGKKCIKLGNRFKPEDAINVQLRRR